MECAPCLPQFLQQGRFPARPSSLACVPHPRPPCPYPQTPPAPPAVPLKFLTSLPAPPPHPLPSPTFVPPASLAHNPTPSCTPIPCPYPHPCRYPNPCPHPIPACTVPMATAAHPAPTSQENGGESTTFPVPSVPSVRQPRAWGLSCHPPRSGDTPHPAPLHPHFTVTTGTWGPSAPGPGSHGPWDGGVGDSGPWPPSRPAAGEAGGWEVMWRVPPPPPAALFLAAAGAGGGWSRMNHPRRIQRPALPGSKEGGAGAGGHRRLCGGGPWDSGTGGYSPAGLRAVGPQEWGSPCRVAKGPGRSDIGGGQVAVGGGGPKQ